MTGGGAASDAGAPPRSATEKDGISQPFEEDVSPPPIAPKPMVSSQRVRARMPRGGTRRVLTTSPPSPPLGVHDDDLVAWVDQA